MERYKKSEVKRILSILEESLTEMNEEMAAGLKSPRFKARRASIEALVKALRARAGVGVVAAANATQSGLTGLVKLEAKWQKSILDLAGQSFVSFSAPPVITLKALITDTPFQGDILSEWFGSLKIKTQKLVERNFRIGMARGETIPVLTARLQKNLGGSRRDVESIVRTATTDASAKARQETFRANEDLIQGWRFVATLDGRTSMICKVNDGKTFPIGEGPIPPIHFNCRSTVVPLLKSYKEMNLKIKSLPDGFRASMNGEVPKSQNYNDWLKDQDASFQNETLGPTRAKMFREGTHSLGDFVDDTGSTLTLEELASKS